MMEGFEIHCPNCGTLRRSKRKSAGGCRPKNGCPECGDKQAIFLPDNTHITNDRVPNLDRVAHQSIIELMLDNEE